MEFYPHNIPNIYVGSAVSASIAVTGSLINNFAAIAIDTVNTASLTLNITGSQGTAGTNIPVYGPTGAAGLRGATGFRGDNIFLLSGSWNTDPCSAPVVCYGGYLLYNVGPDAGQCEESQGSATYYSNYNDIDGATGTDANGYILYTDPGCTTPAISAYVHNGSTTFSTDGAGEISSAGCSS